MVYQNYSIPEDDNASSQNAYWPALVTAPLVAIGTFAFWWHREYFPIADRYPWIGCVTGCVVLLLDIMYLTDTRSTNTTASCSLQTLTITIICVPLGIYTFLARSVLLLFRFEIHSDLEKRQNDHNNSMPSSLIEPSIHITPAHLLTSHGSHAHHYGHQPSSHHHAHTFSTVGSGGKDNGNNGNGNASSDDHKHLHGHTSNAHSPPLGQGHMNMTALTHVTSPTATSPVTWKPLPLSYIAPASAPASPRSHIGFPTTTSATPKISAYSWYTRHNYLISRRWIIGWNSGITGICVLFWIVVAIFQSSCGGSYSITAFALYGSIALSIAQGILLLLLGRKLAKHGQDSLGLKVEIRVVAILVIITALIGFPLMVALSAQSWWGVILILIGFIQWVSSVCYPLWLMRRHNQQQDQLVHDVERFSSLADFLKHDECVAAYSAFVAAELSGENLAFYLRWRTYKETHQKKPRGGGHAHNKSHHNHHHSIGVTPGGGGHHQLGPSAPSSATTADVDRIILLSQSAGVTKDGTATIHAKAKSTPIQRALREAYQIYHAFIVTNAPFEINISATAKAKITTHLKAMTTAVAGAQRGQAMMTHDATTLADQADALLLTNILSTFDEASEEVLRLLTQNSYSRFRMSMAYRQLIASLHHHHHPRLGTQSRQASFRDTGHLTSRVAVMSSPITTSGGGSSGLTESPHHSGVTSPPPSLPATMSHRHLITSAHLLNTTSPTSPPSAEPSATSPHMIISSPTPPPPPTAASTSGNAGHKQSHSAGGGAPQLRRAMSSSPMHVWTTNASPLTVGMLKPSSSCTPGGGSSTISAPATRVPSRSSSASTRSVRTPHTISASFGGTPTAATAAVGPTPPTNK